LCVVCLFASLCWSDPSLGRAVKLFGYPKCFVPQLNEQILYLVN
jgi:hypothetical protein